MADAHDVLAAAQLRDHGVRDPCGDHVSSQQDAVLVCQVLDHGVEPGRWRPLPVAAAYRDAMLAHPAMVEWAEAARAEPVALAAYDAVAEAYGGAR